MAGEMSQSEVTRENYPDLFRIKDALQRRGIKSEPKAFDQYQGPKLHVPGIATVWYAEDGFTIERYVNGKLTFETAGASFVNEANSTNLEHGVYGPFEAAKRIATISREGN